ncbi:hypothetical protein MPSEU_001040400 [Mayamaea pseudoterrestris]|nr:hypothetical protein MPSEU_001040400 [Mayamaea pseudoterrestris]
MMTLSSTVTGPTGTPLAVTTSTASGFIALLDEPSVELQTHALQELLACVDVLWHEVAECLPKLEALADEPSCDQNVREIAAAVASRVLFHLEEPNAALNMALQAGHKYFDWKAAAVEREQQRSPYVERLVAAALDAYRAARATETGATALLPPAKTEEATETLLSTEQLLPMIHTLLQGSCAAGYQEHALGMAIEGQETEQVKLMLQAAVSNSTMKQTAPLIKYALKACMTAVSSKSFRNQTLQVIADCLQRQLQNGVTAAAYDLVVTHQLLNQANLVALVFAQLLRGSEQDYLLALQLAFDVMDSGDQAFVKLVAQDLQKSSDFSAAEQSRHEQLNRILVGGFSSELALSFLHKHSKADKLIMDMLKKTLDERASGSRSSILHHAAILTHGYLNAGTTNDSFLRENLDWMKKASNWAKFSATATIGVIHSMHITEAMSLLQPYLPQDPSEDDAGAVTTTGGYAEGGSLYALGLVHGSQAGSAADKRQEATDFIRKHLRASHANEVISHGAALGVGLTAMGSADLAIVNELKELLDTDSAVAGEAAGMAIGMVLVGTGAGNIENSLPTNHKEEVAEIVVELKNYARETQHEKIIRGLALGLALMNYGQEENADASIEEMRTDRDPVMRYGAMYSLALAYCGTGSNKAIRILLHTAVSDVSDDVRMAAVIALAFVLFKTPERVPQLVKLLLESFNPHVRYGSCMAVGIAMAGTGDAESIALLEPMLDDMTDYVRQGALIGTAMIYMQQSDSCNNRKIRSFRERIMNQVAEKHQSTMSKMGAILATGIIDAGGRNCSLILGSRNGFTKMSSAVGMVMWLQHWHWFPMMHMFSLALTPTFTIGLNKDFRYPKNFEIQCNAKPSQFAVPKKLEEKKEERKKRVETVTLSTTAKEKARLARKRVKAGGHDSAAMDIDKEEKVDSKDVVTFENKEGDDDKTDAMEVDKAVEEEDKPKKKREPEPKSFRVQNPSRMTKAQALVCEFDMDQRYRPIRPEEQPIGVIILTDSRPNEEEELQTVRTPSLEPEGELPPPEPFHWSPPVPPPVVSSPVAETSAASDMNAGSGS